MSMSTLTRFDLATTPPEGGDSRSLNDITLSRFASSRFKSLKLSNLRTYIGSLEGPLSQSSAILRCFEFADGLRLPCSSRSIGRIFEGGDLVSSYFREPLPLAPGKNSTAKGGTPDLATRSAQSGRK